MMLDQMFASDVQEEIQLMQDYINNKPPPTPEEKVDPARLALFNDDDIKPELQHQQHHHLSSTDSKLKTEHSIKDEIKSEPFHADLEIDKLPTVLQMLEDSLSSDSRSNLNNNCSESASLAGAINKFNIGKNSALQRESDVKLESFDIETEITQTVIMKKTKPLQDIEVAHPTDANSPSGGAEFSMDYLCTSSNNSSNMKRKRIEDEDENASSSTASKEPFDEWMCIQKELSMMAEKRIELNATSVPVHPPTNNDDVSDRLNAPVHHRSLATGGRDLFYSLVGTPKHDLEHFIGASKSSDGHDSPLSELFNTDSSNFDRRKAGHNRIDSLLESRLEDLFTGHSGSSSLADVQKHHDSNVVVHKIPSRPADDDWIHNPPLQASGGSHDSSKLHWSAGEMLSSTSVSPSSPTQFSTNTVSSQGKRSSCMEQQQQQTTVFHEENSNHRWMMDCAQPTYDFGSAQNSSEIMSTNLKRSWNETMEHISNNKKICFNNIGATSDRDLLSSPSLISHHHLHHNHHNSLDQNSLMNHLNNGASHMSDGSSFADVLQSIGAGQMCGTNANSNASLMSNFDDDINRHVQNAIDSILNLQSNEAESMHFPLDPAMASFLAENSPLSGGSHQLHHHQTNHQPTNHSLANHSMNHHGLHMQHSVQRSVGHIGLVNKRRMHNRMDDISDCLISGGGSDSNGAGGVMMMVDSPGSSDLVGGAEGVGASVVGGGGNGAGEFNIAGGIDEALKSIITS